MMKYYATFLSIFLAINAVNAQITLTANNNFNVGQTLVFKTLDPDLFDSGANGANVTWDYGNLTPTNTGSTEVKDPTDLPNGNLFPSANISTQDAISNNEAYYLNSSNAFSFYGGVTYGGPSPAYTVYTDPQDWIRYPMTYEDNFSDTFSGTVETSAVFSRDGMTNVVADAYGTLITPSGTFNNVLRIKTEMDYTDIFSSLEIDYTETRYLWYDAETGFPLMTHQDLDISGNPFSTWSYIDASPLKTSSVLAQEINLSVFPNPTTDKITIAFNLKEKETVAISVCNLLGKEVLKILDATQITGQHQEDINLGHLPNGTYFVKINIDNQLVTHKFIIQK